MAKRQGDYRVWDLVIVTDSGRDAPHWTANTRESCRRELRSLRSGGLRGQPRIASRCPHFVDNQGSCHACGIDMGGTLCRTTTTH